MKTNSYNEVCDLPDDVVLSVRNVSKKFCRNLKRSMLYGMQDLAVNMLGLNRKGCASVSHELASGNEVATVPEDLRLPSLRTAEFWALQNVSFELRQGETMGLIGLNGSGKSTLLRVLTGIYPPDCGQVLIRGRIGALIALGAGFHPHMTGRENIYLNATILGMSTAEIAANIDSIVDFAEIGAFLDAPVSTYSSGMTVRLGFAIAIHIQPDVLLVDEVLSVGDFQFQRKCVDKMKELINTGVAVIFVSHNLPAVGGLCKTGVLLEHGRVVKQGIVNSVIQQFLLTQKKQTSSVTPRRAAARQSGEVTISRVELLSRDRDPRTECTSGEPIIVHMHLVSCIEIKRAIIGFGISNDEDKLCFGNRTIYDNTLVDIPVGESFYEFRIRSMDLHTGHYRLSVVVFDDVIILPYAYDPEAVLFTVRSPWLETGLTSPVALPRVDWASMVNRKVSTTAY